MANSLNKKEKRAVELASEKDRLSKFKKDFLADFRADKKWRRNKQEDGRFYDGYQWEPDEIAVLRLRKQPDTVINRIKNKIDGICGIQLGLRVDTKAYPSGEREQEAEFISERLRKIEDASDFDSAEARSFEDIVIEGRGWYHIQKKWEGLNAYYCIKRSPNDDWVRDRNSTEDDLSDCERLHHTVMMSLEKAKQLYPKKAKELEQQALNKEFDDAAAILESREVRPDAYRQTGFSSDSFNDEDFGIFADQAHKQIRVVVTYYRTSEVEKFIFIPGQEPIDVTGNTDAEIERMKAPYEDAEVVTQFRMRLNSYAFAWGVELEHLTNIREFDKDAKYPAVMMSGYAERQDGTHYGLVRQMKDPQREVNKRRSKALHLLSVNRVEFLDGAFEDEEAARQEYQKPDGWIKQSKPGQVQVSNNIELGTAQFQLLQQASSEIDQVGAGREVEGQSSANSGRELELRTRIAQQPIRKLFNSLRAGRRRVAQYLLDDIIRELPEDDQARATKYDIIIEEAPDTLNLESETFDQLVKLRTAGVAIPDDTILKFAPIPQKGKQELAEKTRQAQEAMAAQAQAQAGQKGAGGQ